MSDVSTRPILVTGATGSTRGHWVRAPLGIEKARRLLGYRPQVPLEAGLRQTLDWYLRTGHISLGSAIAAFA